MKRFFTPSNQKHWPQNFVSICVNVIFVGRIQRITFQEKKICDDIAHDHFNSRTLTTRNNFFIVRERTRVSIFSVGYDQDMFVSKRFTMLQRKSDSFIKTSRKRASETNERNEEKGSLKNVR